MKSSDVKHRMIDDVVAVRNPFAWLDAVQYYNDSNDKSQARFNADTVGNKYSKLRKAFGLDVKADLAAAVSDLIKSLGLPLTLGQMGFEEKHLRETVKRALADHSNATTPRKATAEEFKALLRAAL